ncbi:MAG: cytochrome c biogenesis CcdA family protein [Gemmatimonadota bacterium]
MADQAAIDIFVAFSAGLLSFLSPCVLPLVPSYLGFVTGMSLEEMRVNRKAGLVHAVLFVLGFTLVFMALGASATALGRLLNYYEIWLQRIGGALIIVLGLWLLGLIRVDWLEREQRIQLADKPLGYVGTVLVGVTFGAGWTPCIGPILGAILGLAATRADLGQGLVLLGAYSAGLAVPFLLAALAVERFLEWFKTFRKHLLLVKRLSGVLLIVVGLLMLTGQFTRMAGWLQGLTPEFLKSRL